MDSLARKEHELAVIAHRIERSQQEKKRIQQQIMQMYRRKRVKKLIQAGLIFEEADILDTYNHDDVLKILQHVHVGHRKDDECDG